MFTSDNGYYLGERRKRQGKVNLHEPSLRVPLIVVGRGVPRGRRYDPVTTVDLAPTLAAYAGVRMSKVDAFDLTKLIEQGDRATVPLELRNLSRVPRYADELRDLKKFYRAYRDCRGKRLRSDQPG